jgi:polyphenol oxidase
VELLTSALLRSPHGFPTREGGVSVGPFRSLNSSTASGDDPQAVAENLRRLAAAAHVALGSLATVSQVHGVALIEAVAPRDPLVANPPLAEADAIWSRTPGVAVGVKTADCVPLLLEDRAGGRVAAVHAGWRGVIGRIAEVAVAALLADGARRENLRVAIGPCIQRCCFEVDGDLPDRFATAFGQAVVVPVEGKAKVHLDLPLALRRSLEGLGVSPSHIDSRSECTVCDSRFFSHRRDRGLSGRHLSFITCVGAAAL